MIVASVAGNNNGWVVTFGLLTAVSVVVLMAFSAAANRAPSGGTIDEELAAQVEGRIRELVETGADETAVRALVRDALLLGTRPWPPANPTPPSRPRPPPPLWL